MKLNIAQVIGLNTDQKAAQVTSSERDGNNFLAVLMLSSDDAFTKGRQALSELEDFYFEFEGAVAEKLSTTFKEAESKFSEGEASFDLCLGAVSGKVLYLIGKGSVEVYLKRADKVSPLLSIGTPTQLISGFVAAGDKLLFATKSLTTFLDSDVGELLNIPIETFEEEVRGKIGTADLEKKPSEYPDIDRDQILAALAVEVLEENLEISPLPSQDQESPESSVDSSLENKPKMVFPQMLSRFFKAIFNLKRYFPESGRGRFILALILIVIVVGGIGYKYKQSRDQKINAQFNQTLTEAQDDFSSAKGLSTLSPGEAKNKLESARNKINQALTLKPKDAGANDLKNQIEQQSSSILQQSSASDFPVFLDLDLIKKDFRVEGMSLSKNKLLLLDRGTKTLVLIDLSKKSNQILAGSESLGDAQLASLNGAVAFIFSKDKAILKVDSVNSKVSIVSKKDSDLGEIKDIYGFAGNVYVLDSGKSATDSGQIWKYLPASGGYSDKREYLSKGTKVDFSSAIRMQIESSIYVLKSGGEILRFTKGDKDNFSYEGLPSGVKDPKSLFVSSDTDNLYLLDSGNSRLLILTKTGSYKGQITGSKFGSATDLVVDEIGKKVYLLEGSKIYTVDLK